ncbi:hypothetical protein BH09ACT4_BH09ACT4_19320 [soil metagenome]
MPSDSELRDRFHEGTLPQGQIDVDAVLRRVRARRRPRIVLAGAASVLAIAAIAVPAALASYSPGASQDTALVAADGAAAPEAASGGGDTAGGAGDAQFSRQAADKVNLCTAPVAEIPLAENGLVITVEPITAHASQPSIPVTVTLTNSGPNNIFGTTGGRPTLTLSADGITIWHTNGPQDMIARIVDLGPGESMTYETTFEPKRCGTQDEAGESFRDGLPAAGAGEYQLSAAIDVSHDDGSAIDLVTGPAAEVTLK